MYEGSSIKAEHEFYDAHRAEFVEKYLGKEVLLYQGKLQGVFNNAGDALDYALNNGFKKNKFMVHTVVKNEPKFVMVPVIMASNNE